MQVIRQALATAHGVLPAYSHRFSPKKFTQHQLFACLVLKTFTRVEVGLSAIRQLRSAIAERKQPDPSQNERPAKERSMSPPRFRWPAPRKLIHML